MFIFVLSTNKISNIVILVEIDHSQFITARLQLPFVIVRPNASKAPVQMHPKHPVIVRLRAFKAPMDCVSKCIQSSKGIELQT